MPTSIRRPTRTGRRRVPSLYVEPALNTHAGRAAADFRAKGDEANAALLDRIAVQPQGFWLGGWSGDVERTVDEAITAGKLRLFVVYNIMQRDLDAASAGGVATLADYLAWIDAICRGIKGRQAWFIVEPDALAMMDGRMTGDQQADRIEAIREAGERLTTAGGRAYLDASDSNWIPADTMADRLAEAGVAGVRGIALNVSHYEALENEIAYAGELRAILGAGVRAIIDCGRNGRPPPPAGCWGNCPGMGLGKAPTTSTGVTGIDALVWAKPPGTSDKPGDGWPEAGEWYLPGALELCRNAI